MRTFLRKRLGGPRQVGVLTVMLVLLLRSTAGATSIQFFTPTGAMANGQPVAAIATFTTGTNSLTITLQNLLNNPTSIGQSLSGLLFTLSTSLTSAGSLTSSSAILRTIASNGTYTDSGPASTGWATQG